VCHRNQSRDKEARLKRKKTIALQSESDRSKMDLGTRKNTTKKRKQTGLRKTPSASEKGKQQKKESRQKRGQKCSSSRKPKRKSRGKKTPAKDVEEADRRDWKMNVTKRRSVCRIEIRGRTCKKEKSVERERIWFLAYAYDDESSNGPDRKRK